MNISALGEAIGDVGAVDRAEAITAGGDDYAAGERAAGTNYSCHTTNNTAGPGVSSSTLFR